VTLLFALVAALGLGAGSAQGQSSRELPSTVKAVKPSIVGIGTLYPTRQPQPNCSDRVSLSAMDNT